MTEINLMISSGQGPRECSWVVARLAESLSREWQAKGLKCRILGEGEELPRSLILQVSGAEAETQIQSALGTVQWIGNSPFRPGHKRRNWFVGISRLADPGNCPELDPRHLTFSAHRASGPGGQHVNKTNSAVRLVHQPTGLAVVASEERSQHANKRLALIKLAARFDNMERENMAQVKQQAWSAHYQLERGNPIRRYKGPAFKQV